VQDLRITLEDHGVDRKLKQELAIKIQKIGEAAAATEADIYIPFHLKPSRLLVVGDPRQLPSIVKSNRAKRFGLDKSLHERLIFQCGAEYTMLDVQYRMHPTICAFPSNHFYSGKLLNGGKSARQQHSLLLNSNPLVFLEVDNGQERTYECSLCNDQEADAVVKLVKQVENRDDSDHLRVITF
jgi:superfamily I DNA and/or RNA helicase